MDVIVGYPKVSHREKCMDLSSGGHEGSKLTSGYASELPVHDNCLL